MLLQKLYRPLVELVHLLVYGSVSAAFEDDKFCPPNLGLHTLGKALARDHVVAATRNLGRGRNLAEMRLDIVRNHRVRLSHKGVHGLRGAPPDKSRQRLDVVWPGDIEFGGETPRENACITVSVTLPEPLTMTCQPSTTVLTKRSVLVQPSWSDKDLTCCGYLAASHIPTAAPNERPEIWARSTFNARIKALRSSGCTLALTGFAFSFLFWRLGLS
jgi:hypothetical protein